MSAMAILARALTASQVPHSQRGIGCYAFDPLADPPYGYDPSLSAGIVFSVVFGLSMLAHIAQFSIKRKWWYATFAIGALGELMGWAARAASHNCPYNNTLFTLQISVLIISPCFFSAGIYYILGELIKEWGRKYSLISPRLYMFIFVGFDLVSIIIQGVGGGMASSAGINGRDTAPGTNIMIAGIVIQLVSMCSFVGLWIITLWRARAISKPKTTLLLATSFSAVMILVRNFYRCIELAQGWSGYLITHEIYFCVLDGALMALAVGIFNFFHPVRYFGSSDATKNEPVSDSSSEEMRAVA